MGSKIYCRALPGIRLDHGSNTAFSREIFWDHRSDFGIHGHVCTAVQRQPTIRCKVRRDGICSSATSLHRISLEKVVQVTVSWAILTV